MLIDLLKNHPYTIQQLAQLSYELIAKVWIPNASLERAVEKLQSHLNDNTLPLTFVALDGDKPIGMCSLRETDGIQPDLTPWLGSLVVDPAYQKQGVGESLIDATKDKARSLGYSKLFLFAFDPTIPKYYSKLGWNKITMDEFAGHPVTVMDLRL